jgi:multiple sugar transport system substrate-binding protein
VLAVAGVVSGCSEQERPRLTALFIKDEGYSEEDIRTLSRAFEIENKKFDVMPFFAAEESVRKNVISFSAARAQAYDVIVVDAIALAEFVEGDFLMDITERVKGEPVADLMPSQLEGFAAKGKQYAMPWLMDCQFLFYNKKMLKAAGFASPPRTWSDLAAKAKVMKEKKIVEYPIVGQWGHSEDLVCDFACMLFARGGAFLTPKGTPAFADKPGVEALAFMKRLIDDGLANPASLEARSDDARRILSEGQAAFNLNWFYVYGAANDRSQSKVAGEIGMALAPGEKDKKSATVGDALGLAIMKESQNPDMAWRYIRLLTGKENQKKYCKTSLPVWRSLYDDREFLTTRLGIVQTVTKQYESVTNRPRVFYYSRLSTALQDEIVEAFKGRKKPQEALAAAAERVKEAAKERLVYTR